MGNHTVIVWDEPQTVTTYRKYKTVWVASGEYKGESHSRRRRPVKYAFTYPANSWTRSYRSPGFRAVMVEDCRTPITAP